MSRERETQTVNGTTRARSGRLLVKKTDQAGREYVGQNETIISGGMFSSAEMERELQRAADESSEEVVDMRIDHFDRHEALPMSDVSPSRAESPDDQWGFASGTATWPPREDGLTANTRRERA